ncbi:hypothetical protein FRC15_001510 [Serendipita sp. 397]|nr:hypothetical protein FRC15_001510 [Serendipita sp. 397]
MAAKENPPKESGATKADETIEQQDDLVPQEEGPDTTNLPNEAGAEMEREYQEEDVLDLPDDMDMGQNEAKAEEDVEEDEEGSSYEGDLGNTNDQEEYEEDPDLESFAPMDVTSDGDVEEKEKEEGIEHNATAEAEETEGQGQEDVQGGSNSMMAEGASAPHEVDADTGVEKQHMQDTESHQQFPQSHTEMADPKETGATSKGTQSETRNEHIQDHDSLSTSKEEAKAQRTLAEAFAEVQRRYQEILERVEKEVQSLKDNEKDNSKVEYTNENAADVQAALAPAQEEEVAKLRDLNLVDEIAEPRLEEDAEMVDLTETNTPRVADHESQLLNTRDEQIRDAPDKDMESAFTREDIYRRATSMEGDADVPSNIAGEHPREVTSEEVEARLVSWQNRASTSEDAYSMWRLYSSLTHELAWNLCEQLRLILEPTKATRLRGDYRTGKRLNMKKIIPYIASEYTKDKIWLRRTRPSQREYQILVALDDSRSMSESHSEHLAFETLALVSKALTRLEAGDVFVAKFGEKVELLHGVDDGPFNDAAGAKVIGSFAFDQTSTDVLKLVEASCSMLQEARDKRVASSSASDLWQLEIIISDGVCSNHDRLRAAIRRASEQKILIVFIIVDAIGNSPSESNRATGSTRSVENSILTMKQVKPDLTIERYLDTFPFEYYVVLRSVNALPDVLSSTLKQFFQRITEE